MLSKATIGSTATILIILIFGLSACCQKKKVEADQPPLNELSITDSTKLDSIGNRKSIHQQEWEEHRQEFEVDTVKTNQSF